MRTKFASLLSSSQGSTKSRALLVALTTVVVLAVAGTTFGYTALSKSVTLSLDGEPREVTSMADTVGEVLEDEGIEIGEHDVVAPSLDEEIEDGDRVSIRFGRPLELEVDGKEQTHWVTSTDVATALGEIGSRFADAELSVSRSASIGREGMALEVVTPKKLTLALAGKKPVRRVITALTVEDVLDEVGVEVGRRDEVKPGLKRKVDDGDRIVFTDVRVATERVRDEAIGHGTVERADDSMFEGESETVRAGRDGVRDVTYRVTYRNGEVVSRTVKRAEVLREPVDTIVRIGTKEEPAPAAPAANYAAGSTVWDRLAQCESGGNWAINTGNGYYGGLQFSAATWQSVGGTGLPHQHSREEQIKRGQILQSRAGWGQWPHCAAQLGLL